MSELLSLELTIFKSGVCLADEDCKFLRCIISKCQFPQTMRLWHKTVNVVALLSSNLTLDLKLISAQRNNLFASLYSVINCKFVI